MPDRFWTLSEASRLSQVDGIIRCRDLSLHAGEDHCDLLASLRSGDHTGEAGGTGCRRGNIRVRAAGPVSCGNLGLVDDDG